MFDISIFQQGSEAFRSKLSLNSRRPLLDTKKTTPNIGVSPKKPRSASRRGSLKTYRGDAEDSVRLEKSLYFTYGSRDTLKSFSLFTTVKTLTKLNLGHGDKFEIEIVKE